MTLGGRGLSRILRAVVTRSHYVALAGVFRALPRPWDALRRYLFAAGDYPVEVEVRTPLGPQRVRIDTQYDFKTLIEVFCRLDYAAPRDLRLAVDVGSNIGLTALYFLTRNREARAILFEPDPKNVARLRRHLAGFEGRWRLHEAAVGVEDATLSFSVEPTGRFGSLDPPESTPGAHRGETITVACLDADRVLREIAAEHGAIDILKIDIEGWETRVLAHLGPEALAAIGLIYAEHPNDVPPPPGFERRRYGGMAIYRRADAG